MKVLKATAEQKKIIERQTTGINLIRFVLDQNGNYIVGRNVLNDPKFSHITELKNLQEIDYNPIML